MNIEATTVSAIKKNLSDSERTQFDAQFSDQRKSPDTAFVLSIVMGVWGVDRFYIGNTGLGFLKLLTLGDHGLVYYTEICQKKERVYRSDDPQTNYGGTLRNRRVS